MPAAYTLETLPDPLDPAVRLRAIPASTWAVIKFSGLSSEKLVAEKTDELRRGAAEYSVALSNNISYARYNPPWTLWFLRRNEILIEVAQ
jgi:hypothetical protein